MAASKAAAVTSPRRRRSTDGKPLILTAYYLAVSSCSWPRGYFPLLHILYSLRCCLCFMLCTLLGAYRLSII